MFFVVRSNDSFNFPRGLIKYTVSVTKTPPKAVPSLDNLTHEEHLGSNQQTNHQFWAAQKIRQAAAVFLLVDEACMPQAAAVFLLVDEACMPSYQPVILGCQRN